MSFRRGSTVGEGARGRAGVRTYNSAVADAEGGAFELGTDGPKVILVGLDDSVTSMRAGAYAAGLARRQGPGRARSPRRSRRSTRRPRTCDGRPRRGRGDWAWRSPSWSPAATLTPNCGGWPTRCAPTPSSWAPRCRPGTGGSGRWRCGWSRPAGGRSPWFLRHCSADTDPRRSREAR